MNLSHLKQLLAQHGVSQTDLARILGRDKSVITNLFQGKRQLKAGEAALIASHIGVPVARILGLTEQAGALMEPPMLIPFQHEPEQGRKHSGVVKKDGKFFLEVEESSYSPKAYALEAHDDSMNLSGILAGDIVISELDRPCKPGQVVIAQHYQGRGAKTVIRRYQPPFLMPHSTHISFKPLNLEREEARLVSPVLKLVRVF
ncbi:MAG: helix-turn-helix domain-containing protein [Pseudomonadota bacterium]|nr:helix-turn-helix domain-containing protein [Pseudomonadota bacterium]